MAPNLHCVLAEPSSGNEAERGRTGSLGYIRCGASSEHTMTRVARHVRYYAMQAHLHRIALCTIILCFLLTLTSCSFIFVHGPSGTPTAGHAAKKCTTDEDAPVADSIIAALGLAGGIAGFTAGASCSGRNWDCLNAQLGQAAARVGGAIGGLLFLVHLPSAIYGYIKTSACTAQSRRPARVDQEVPSRRAPQKRNSNWDPFSDRKSVV